MSDVIVAAVIGASAMTIVGLTSAVLTHWKWLQAAFSRAPQRIGGIWGGTSMYVLPSDGAQYKHPLESTVALRLRQRGRILSGTATITVVSEGPYRDAVFEVALAGRVMFANRITLQFVSARPDVVDFGACLAEISENGRRMDGYVLMNDLDEPRVVLARVKLQRMS